MEIMVGKTAGFCMGVKNAVDKTKEVLEEQKGKITYCLGELVHNSIVMEELEKNGLKVIEKLEQIPEPIGKKVIFRAHGVTKEVYEEAEKLGLEVIDLTCPSVLTTHQIVQRYANRQITIFLIGEKKHPEVIGTASFCGKEYQVIETKEELDLAVEKAKERKIDKLLIIAQTTFHAEKFQEFVTILQEELKEQTEIEVKNTICQATRRRQQETEELSKVVDSMLIIGGKKSANTNKLYEIAEQNCHRAMLIEGAEECTKEMLNQIRKFSKVGIMAGASTPQESINEVVSLIKNKLDEE